MTEVWTIAYVVVMLASFVGLGVIGSASGCVHRPVMSTMNPISAIAVVGAILVGGGDYPSQIHTLAAIALFASTMRVVSAVLITDRMLKLFRPTDRRPEARPAWSTPAVSSTT
jgi:NAD(P) transhydrogenase subunit alpha